MQAAKECEAALRDSECLTAGGAAWGAIASALAPLEAAQFNELQAGTLLRLRTACAGAAHWSDGRDSHDLVLSGKACKASNDATHGTALGWEWPGVLDAGQRLLWRCALDVAAALEAAVAQLRHDDSSVRVGAVCKTFGDAAALYDALVLQPCLPLTNSRRGLLHVNSLLHVADAITLLPLTVTLRCAARSQVSAAAAAAAAELAASAQEHRGMLVRRISKPSKLLLAELPPLTNLNQRDGLAARRCMQKVCSSLRSASDVLARVCAPADQVATFCSVLSHVCEHACAKVLFIRDISESDCTEVHAIFERLWAEVPASAAGSFLQTSPAANAGAAAAPPWPPRWTRDVLADVIVKSCQPARKLAAIGGMLNNRMAEVVAQWEAGLLAQVGLSAGEVCGVLRAVFADNSHRKECIATIMREPAPAS